MPGGGLRPAVEDLWGAGFVVDQLVQRGWGTLSPEATAARAAWRACQDHMREALLASASGTELADKGYGADVELAAAGPFEELVEVRDRHPRGDPLLHGDATQEVLKVRRFDEQVWGGSDERHQGLGSRATLGSRRARWLTPT